MVQGLGSPRTRRWKIWMPLVRQKRSGQQRQTHSNEVGYERCSARCSVAVDSDIVDRAAEGLGDGLGDVMSRRSGVVHGDTGAIPGEAMADVVLLLEVVGEREVDEGPPPSRELHGGGEAALYDGHIAYR